MALREKKRLYTDLIALLAFGAVFFCLFFSQQVGIGLADEQFYYTIVKRLLQGDRLFVDEWHLSQMFSVLLIPPVKLYLRIFGGADGLILAMRRLFLVWELFTGGYVYLRLRKHGFPALVFALALCVFFPYYAFTYYTFAVHGTVILLVTLFASEKKPKAPVLVLMGVVAAMTVLAEPILSAAYILYSAQVLVRFILQKKGLVRKSDGVPSLRVWLFITVGVAAAFAVFIVWIFVSCGRSFRPLLESVPALFSGKEYSFDPRNETNNVARFGMKLATLLRMYGWAPPVGLILTAVAGFVLRKAFPAVYGKRRWRALLFCSLCVCLTAAYAYLFYAVFVQRSYRESFTDNILMHGGFFPVLLFAFGCFGLQKQGRGLSFAFLQTGAFASALVDFSSDNCMCYGGVITLLPAALGFRALLSEFLRCPAPQADAPVPEKRTAAVAGKVAVCALACLSAACVLFWAGKAFVQCGAVPAVGFLWAQAAKAPYTVKLEDGPFRGLFVTAAVNDLCAATERDMAAAAAIGPGPLYVDSLCPMPYLYAENPMGSYSSFYVEEDRPHRLLRFWEMHPEKTPEIIYVPYYDYMTVSYFDRLAVKNPGGGSDSGAGGSIRLRFFFDKNAQAEKLALFTRLFSCEVTEGEAGYLLHVTGTKNP